jgi:hypothetical protein
VTNDAQIRLVDILSEFSDSQDIEMIRRYHTENSYIFLLTAVSKRYKVLLLLVVNVSPCICSFLKAL